MRCPNCQHDTCLLVCERCREIVPSRNSFHGLVTHCLHCGAINAANYVFCGDCGRKRSAIATAATAANQRTVRADKARPHTCRSCNHDLAKGIEICPFCGTDCRPREERALTLIGQFAVAAAFLLIAAVPVYLYLLPNGQTRMQSTVARHVTSEATTLGSSDQPPAAISVPDSQASRGGRVVNRSVKVDIARTISAWIGSFQARNLAEHVRYYAPHLTTYFTWHDVKHAEIVKDKRRFFDNYPEIVLLNVRDLQINELGPGVAEATFLKDWHFLGRGEFSGTVLQRLRLERQAGKWAITSEEELRTLKRRKTRQATIVNYSRG